MAAKTRQHDKRKHEGEKLMELSKRKKKSSSKAKTSETSPRNYRKEYDNYHSSPEQKKRRAQRNASRAKLLKSGAVKKGDGKDVHHKDRSPSNKSRKNLSVTSKKYNRSRNG